MGAGGGGSLWNKRTASERKSEPRVCECITRESADSNSDVWKSNYGMEGEREVENKSGTDG